MTRSQQALIAANIIQVVCQEYGITDQELRCKIRKPKITVPRQTAALLMELNGVSRSYTGVVLNISKPSAIGQSYRAKIVSSVDRDYHSIIIKLQELVKQ